MASSKETSRHCYDCYQTEADGAVFGILAETGKRDMFCVKCRFARIDDYASDRASIRRDMRRMGVPLNGDES